jgi:hypothetical protein
MKGFFRLIVRGFSPRPEWATRKKEYWASKKRFDFDPGQCPYSPADLLPINGLLPEGFDPDAVRIVLWVFLFRPTWNSFTSAVGGNYVPCTEIVEGAVRRGFTRETAQAVVAMLAAEGLVSIKVKKPGRWSSLSECCSLKTRESKTRSSKAGDIAFFCEWAMRCLRAASERH